ncbi:MAG: hypothetical protein ABJA78_18270 [Ferruginibacter sp.]
MKYKILKLNAERVAPPAVQLPFASIRIIDSRYDTSKLGFVVAGIHWNKKDGFRKATFKQGVAGAIEQYYHDYYAKSFQTNGFELLIVMKKLWLSGIEDGKNRPDDIQNNLRAQNSLHVKWEYYLGRNDQYLPFKRVDTVLTITSEIEKYIDEVSDEKKEVNFKYALKMLIEILDYNKAVNNFDTKEKKNLAFIKSYNEDRFKLPVLQDSIFNTGVYLNFNEFKNNRPSLNTFKEKKMKYSLIHRAELYIEDATGNDIPVYWGYFSDGDLRYGKIGNDKMYRIGNTFQVFIQVSWYNSNRDNNSSTIPSRREVWIPYQVDMETGTLY